MSGKYGVEERNDGWATVGLMGDAGSFAVSEWFTKQDAQDEANRLNQLAFLASTMPHPVVVTHPAASAPGPLVRLETGDWVDPGKVVGVIVDTYADTGPPEIALCLDTGSEMRVGRYIDAQDMTDRIAAQINAARLGGGAMAGEGAGE